MAATIGGWIDRAAERGVTVADDTEAAQALVRASDYVRIHYVVRYGLPEDHQGVDEAVYIAAGYELATPGFWSKTYTPAEQKVLTKVDKIQWTPAGVAHGPSAALPVSPDIHALLAPRNSFVGMAVL